MGCTYVKEFTFSKGGAVPETTKKAVAKHEKAMHPGKPLTKLKKGGAVKEKATGEVYASRSDMLKHEKTETPRMQREEVMQKSRKSVPVAPTEPLIALKCGGRAKK